jgi:myosin heavy subunit
MVSFVWIPDDEYEWALAEIVEDRGSNVVVTSSPLTKTATLGSNGYSPSNLNAMNGNNTQQDKKTIVIAKEKIKEFDLSHIDEYNDLSMMKSLSEGPMLHNLRRRFFRDHIYTYACDILISINPYKIIPGLYDSPVSYLQSTKSSLFKPHIYVIANTALKRLSGKMMDSMDSNASMTNQSIIINGESGSG